jgi:hypothetical protein
VIDGVVSGCAHHMIIFLRVYFAHVLWT